MNRQRISTKKMAQTAMLVAMAAAMHWLEGTMPPLFAGMPGVKLGLANVFTLFALQTLGKGEALLVSVLRCGLGLLLTGAPVGTLYAFGGALTSLFMMIMMQKLGFGVLAQSVAGAVTHNTTQGLLAMWLTNTQGLLFYFPVLWIAAIPTGLLIGAACAGMQRALKGMIP